MRFKLGQKLIDTIRMKKNKKEDSPKYIHSLRCPRLGEEFGCNFKEYFITENMPTRIEKLKSGLDDKSCRVIDAKIDGFLNLPLFGTKYTEHCMFDTRDVLYNQEDLAENEDFLKILPELKSKYKIEDFCMRPETFYFHHGLKLLPENVLNYIKNKIFIDCGAYHAESSIIFAQYNPSLIYAFEIIPESKNIFFENLKNNNIDENKVIFVNKGCSNKNYFVQIDNSENGYKQLDQTSDNGTEIEIVALDQYFNSHENIGLIKMDIEGAEYDAILGAKDIILKSKPVLLISIYHTPKQFFELKPLLEELTNNSYNFMVRDLNSYNSNCNETTLICIPKEISK